MLPPFDAIAGIEIVSQEAESLVLAFATEQGLAEFESRLASLARDGTVTRRELLFAIGDFDHWTAAYFRPSWTAVSADRGRHFR